MTIAHSTNPLLYLSAWPPCSFMVFVIAQPLAKFPVFFMLMCDVQQTEWSLSLSICIETFNTSACIKLNLAGALFVITSVHSVHMAGKARII